MQPGNPATAEINRHLQEAIDGLRKDIARVEMWAVALNCFSQPVPDYQPSREHLIGDSQRQSGA